MRQYESIWKQIKALPPTVELAVRVHKTAQARVRQAVKLEKTKEVAIKKKIGMLRQGPLAIRVTEDTQKQDVDFCIIFFALEWDGSKL